MKKILSLMLTFCAVVFLSACTASESDLEFLYTQIESQVDCVIEVNYKTKINNNEYKGTVEYSAKYIFNETSYYEIKEYTSEYDAKGDTDEDDLPEAKSTYKESYYDFSNRKVYTRSSADAEFTVSSSFQSRNNSYIDNEVVDLLDDEFENNNKYVAKYDKVTSYGSIEKGRIKSVSKSKAVISFDREYDFSSSDGTYSKSNQNQDIVITFKTEEITLPVVI